MFWVDADEVFEHVIEHDAEHEYGGARAREYCRRGCECDGQCYVPAAPEVDSGCAACHAAQKLHERDLAEEMARCPHSCVQRPHRQYVERSPGEPFESILRVAKFPALMFDWDFADAKTAVVREHGNKAVEFAVDGGVVDDFAPEQFFPQLTSCIGKPNTLPTPQL